MPGTWAWWPTPAKQSGKLYHGVVEATEELMVRGEEDAAETISKRHKPITVWATSRAKMGGVYSCHASLWSYGLKRSHPYIAGTQHVEFRPTKQILVAPIAKRREGLGESHRG